MRRNNKGNLSIVLGIIASIIVIALGVGAAVFLTIKADKEGASEVAELFVTSFGNLDVNRLDDCIPSELFDDETMEILLNEDSYEALELLKYGSKDVEISGITKYNKQSAMDEIAVKYGVNLDVKVAYLVTVDYTEYYTVDGEKESDNYSDELICGKIGKYWYVVDPEYFTDKIDIIEELTDMADGEMAKALLLDYFDAFGNRDIEGMKDSVPEEILKVESVDKGYDDLEDILNDLDSYAFAISDVEITDQDEYDKDKAKKSVKDEFEVELEIEKAYEVSVDYNVHMEFGGEDYDEVESADVICGKIDGEWYIVDPDEIVTN